MNKFFLFLLGMTISLMGSGLYIFSDHALASNEEAKLKKMEGRAEIAKRLKVAQVMSEQEAWQKVEFNFSDTDFFGSLKSKEKKFHKLDLPEGSTYRIVATCIKCNDMDLEVYRESEKDENSLFPRPYLIDNKVDLVPILHITPTPEHTKFTLLVQMYSCPASSCDYGFEIYSKPTPEPEEEETSYLNRQEGMPFISAFAEKGIKKQIEKYPLGEWTIDLDYPLVTEGDIEEGEQKKHSLTLKGGTSYVIIGFGSCTGTDCENEEADLDLSLFGPAVSQYNEDKSTNPWTKVSVSIPGDESLTFNLLFEMYKCPVHLCHYNFVVYSKPHSHDLALMQLDVPEPHFSRLLQLRVQVLSNRNPTLIDTSLFSSYAIMGWDLANKQTYEYTFKLPKGEYVFLGLCSNCSNLDLFLYNPNGTSIKDDLPDTIPIIPLNNDDLFSGDSPFTLSVRMQACPSPNESCFFSLEVFRKKDSDTKPDSL